MTGHQDVLRLLAPLLRVRPELQDFCRFGGSWRSAHRSEAKGWAAFHIVTKGACSVERKGQPTIRLEAGDVLLLPNGDAHVAYGGDGDHFHQAIRITETNAIRIKETEGNISETELICGRLNLESATNDLLLMLLPQAVILRFSGQVACRKLAETIRDELDADRAGAAAIARDLASALFVMLLRAHLEAEPPADGLLALLGHRETAKAALAMLGAPARHWSLDELASIGAVSRATLVRAFRRICGMSPLAFLTEIRLGIARNRIAHTTDSLSEIAADVGYQSESALSRALFRHFAIRPGALRRAGADPRPD
ncbi:cupin domain-containing protein [Rhizobium sp. BR 314]|uniref:cupin domain-containing protein n=1 Tax=Rhizobium sp. BR 314 TaxID=3040013 RepID=UPI0039BFFBCD